MRDADQLPGPLSRAVSLSVSPEGGGGRARATELMSTGDGFQADKHRRTERKEDHEAEAQSSAP